MEQYRGDDFSEMDIEGPYYTKRAKKLRVRVTTNRGLRFVTAVKPEATVGEFAHRALTVYLQLSGQPPPSNQKQLTVTAVKQGIFYLPKSEQVASLLNQDDQVEVVIVKAKPKYPNQIFEGKPIMPPIELKNEIDNQAMEKAASKRQMKRDKKRLKQNLKSKTVNFPADLPPKQPSQTKIRKPTPQLANQFSINLQPTVKQSKHEKDKPKQRERQKEKEKEKEEISVPLVVPSPKITFHCEPKLESPLVAPLSESLSKKLAVEGQESERQQKRSRPLYSPQQHIKSPSFSVRSQAMPLKQAPAPLQLSQTPNHRPLESSKSKDKDEAGSLSLQAKSSQDKQRKRHHNQSAKSSEHIPQKQTQKVTKKAEEPKVEPEKQPTAQSKKIKPTHSVMVVEDEDSDSQEIKPPTQPSNQDHRMKQFGEIQRRMQWFKLEESEQEQEIQ